MIDSLLLHDLAHARPVRTPYIDIERQVALRHGITVEDLRGPCRRSANGSAGATTPR